METINTCLKTPHCGRLIEQGTCDDCKALAQKKK